jgi:streptogramin lyase
MASVTFVLKIPTVAPANGMRPHYISLGTKSFSVAVTLAGVSETTTNANASPSSPGCTSASGALLCSVQVDAPPGIDAFTVTTYDAPLTAAGATQGNVLSTGTANATVVLHMANTVDVTLDGVPALMTMSLPNPAPPQGTAITETITTVVQDADGYTIVGPFARNVQITLSTNTPALSIDVNGQAGELLQSSSDVAKLAYNGKGVDSATVEANLQAAASGTYIATASFAPAPTFGSETTFAGSFAGSHLAIGNNAYAITQASPAQLIYGTIGGTPSTLAIPSGNAPVFVWMTPLELDFSEAGAVGWAYYAGPSAGAIFEYTTPAAGISCLTAFDGLDHMWFMESAAAKLAYTDIGGNFTQYPVGIAGALPSACTFGFNTYVWYSDPGTNAFGYFNESTDTFTELPIPTAGANPGDITTVDSAQQGPQMWFLERGGQKIGIYSLQTAGITEFSLGSSPVRMVGGNNAPYVWVLLANGNLQRIDEVAHTVTNITVPSSANGPIVDLVDDGVELNLIRGDATHASFQQYFY